MAGWVGFEPTVTGLESVGLAVNRPPYIKLWSARKESNPRMVRLQLTAFPLGYGRITGRGGRNRTAYLRLMRALPSRLGSPRVSLTS